MSDEFAPLVGDVGVAAGAAAAAAEGLASEAARAVVVVVPASLRIACTAASLFNLVSPWPVLRRMLSAGKDTGEIAFFTLWSMLLCNALWLAYYLFKPGDDSTAFYISAFGTIVSFTYLIIQFYLTKNAAKAFRFRMLCLGFGILSVCTWYFNVIAPPKTRHQHAGLACNVVNIILLWAPLSKAGEVLRTKNARSIPFLPAFASTLGSFLWSMWGYLDNDMYMLVPAIVGMLFGGIQLALIAVYSKPQDTSARYKHIE